MDQLKQVGEFIWKWRFWFCLGIVLILSAVIQPVGTAKVQAMIQRRKAELDAAHQQIMPFTSGDMHPNQTWQDEVKAKERKAQEEIGKVQERLYAEQASRMVWPAVVAEQFNGRPFNTPLADNQGRYLFLYGQDFANQIKELMTVADPITINKDRTVTGKVSLPDSAIERPNFSEETPKTQDAWLAQEQIWIQRAVLETIRKINDAKPEYKDWYTVPVRQIIAIKLGSGSVDIRKLAERAGEVTMLTLPPVVGEDAPAAPTTAGPAGGQDKVGNINARYSELTPEGRTIPISVGLLIDQRKIPEVIAGLEQIPFNFVLLEVSWNVPSSRVNPPAEVEDALNVAPGISREAVEHTVQLVAFGELFIREMPPAIRQKWDEEQQRKLNPTAAPPVDPNAPPVDPNAPPVDPNAPPVDPNAPPVDPNAPPVDPNAPPVDPNAPPVDPM